MKQLKLLVIALLLSITVNAQASLSSFYAFKTTTTVIGKDVFLKSFDKYTTEGGGWFMWVTATNTAITDIPGIRIKPRNNETGYWLRADITDIHIGWFGASCSNTTWTSIGYSQSKLDSIYGVGFASTSDTPDRTAIRSAFKLMETLGYQTVSFSPKSYYVNAECKLPKLITSVLALTAFEIDGNNAYIYTTNGNTFTVFNHAPTSQDSADGVGTTGVVNRRFNIHDLTISCYDVGSGSSGWNQTGIYIGAAYNSTLENLTFNRVNIAIVTRFAMSTMIIKPHILGIKTGGILISNGDWSGASFTHAQGNNTTIIQPRIFVASSTAVYGIKYEECSGGRIESAIIEDQSSTIQYGIVWDNLNASATTSKEFIIEGCHAEISFTKAAFYIKGYQSPHIRIVNPYSQYPCVLVAGESLSTLFIEVDMVAYFIGNIAAPPVHKFVNIGTIFWSFKDMYIVNVLTATDMANAGRWETTGWTGATVPSSSRIRYTADPRN